MEAGFRGEMMLVHSLCSCQIARWPNRKWSRSQQAMAAMIPWCYFFLVSVRARLWVIQPRVFFCSPDAGNRTTGTTTLDQTWLPKNAWHPTLPVRGDPRHPRKLETLRWWFWVGIASPKLTANAPEMGRAPKGNEKVFQPYPRKLTGDTF